MLPQSLRPLPNLWFSSAPLQSRSDILGSTLNGRQWVQPGGSKLFVRSALPLVQHTKPANSIQPAVPAKARAHPTRDKTTKRKHRAHEHPRNGPRRPRRPRFEDSSSSSARLTALSTPASSWAMPLPLRGHPLRPAGRPQGGSSAHRLRYLRYGRWCPCTAADSDPCRRLHSAPLHAAPVGGALAPRARRPLAAAPLLAQTVRGAGVCALAQWAKGSGLCPRPCAPAQ